MILKAQCKDSVSPDYVLLDLIQSQMQKVTICLVGFDVGQHMILQKNGVHSVDLPSRENQDLNASSLRLPQKKKDPLYLLQHHDNLQKATDQQKKAEHSQVKTAHIQMFIHDFVRTLLHFAEC